MSKKDEEQSPWERKEKEKPTEEKIALEGNLITAFGNIHHCNNSQQFFKNFMVARRFPIWKEQAKRRYFQIIKLYKWQRKNSFQQIEDTTLTYIKS